MKDELIELIDGRFVRRDAEQWRHECEARYILSLPFHLRRQYLADIEAKRGVEASDALKDTMMKMHALKKAAA